MPNLGDVNINTRYVIDKSSLRKVNSSVDSIKNNSKNVSKSMFKTSKSINTANNGIGNMVSRFTKVAVVSAVVVGTVMKIKSAVKETTEAYREQLQQEVKLTTVMKQRMNSTKADIKEILNLTNQEQSTGVLGDEIQLAAASQLATFLKSKEALMELTPAINDLIVAQKGFNATSSDGYNTANMVGKVLQGQIGALNRAGISFNEYEESVLKSGNEMERAAMLAQIITNNIGDMNQSLGNTPLGRLRMFSNRMGDIKERFGEAFINISTMFLPALNRIATVLDYLSSKFLTFSNAIAEVFGGSKTKEQPLSSVSGNAENATSSMKDLEKQSKKTSNSFASFDKVITLGDSSDGSSDGSSEGEQSSGLIGGVSSGVEETEEVEGSLNKITKKIENFKEKISIIGKGVSDFYTSAIKPLVDWIGIKLKDALNFSLEELGKWGKWFSDNKDRIATFTEEIGKMIGPIADEAWEIFKEAITKIGEEFRKFGDWVLDNSEDVVFWITAISTALLVYKGLTTAFAFATFIKGIWLMAKALKGATIAQTLLNVAMLLNPATLIIAAIALVVGAIIGLMVVNEDFREVVINVFKAIWDFIKSFVGYIVDSFKVIIEDVLKVVSDYFYYFKEKIGTYIDLAKQVLGGLIDFIVGVFTGDWERAFNGLIDFVSGVFDGLTETLMIPFELVAIGVNSVLKDINGVLEKLKLPKIKLIKTEGIRKAEEAAADRDREKREENKYEAYNKIANKKMEKEMSIAAMSTVKTAGSGYFNDVMGSSGFDKGNFNNQKTYSQNTTTNINVNGDVFGDPIEKIAKEVPDAEKNLNSRDGGFDNSNPFLKPRTGVR